MFRRFLNTIDLNQLDDIVVQFGIFIMDDPSLQQGLPMRNMIRDLLNLNVLLDTTDLTRQLTKKIEIYNYYFSFLKLVGVWNKVTMLASYISMR